jgi:membrane associated rhomboid family serine protease
MFLPLRDDNPTRRFPYLTVALIAVNTAIFLYSLTSPRGFQGFILEYGAIPGAISSLAAPLTLLTSMFLHGSVLHLAGNMLYLWIFGNNIEDVLGPARFILFYLASGLAAGLIQVAVNPASNVPMIGASGAVAGILGAYWVLFPRARVNTLVFLIFFIQVIPIPASIVLGLWFLMQLLNVGMGGGVAWFAHIGGFLTGALLIRLYTFRRPRREAGRASDETQRGFIHGPASGRSREGD